MHRNAFHALVAQYSVISRFEGRVEGLKRGYVLSRHHQYAEQQKDGMT